VVTVVNGASKEAEAVYNLIALQSRFTPVSILIFNIFFFFFFLNLYNI